MATHTDAVSVEYYGGIYDPSQPENIVKVQLFGAKRWCDGGWVYRLEGEVVVVVEEHEVQPRVFHYDDILIYVVEGVIESASELSFWDTEHLHEYTWEDLEAVLNYELGLDEDADPITDEECEYAMQDLENEEEGMWGHYADDSDSDDSGYYSM